MNEAQLQPGVIGYCRTVPGMLRIASVEGNTIHAVRPNGEKVQVLIGYFTAHLNQARVLKEFQRKIERASRFNRQPEATPGARVCSLGPAGCLGTIDRILDNGNFIVITDMANTVCVGREEFRILSKPRLTARDFLFLQELKVKL